jgi:hypothetical protein
MSNRGGKRPGAGRPKGSRDIATVEQGATIAELARAHTDVALQALVKIATSGESESARVAAANAILDRGYGKPTQPVDHNGINPCATPEERAARLAALKSERERLARAH